MPGLPGSSPCSWDNRCTPPSPAIGGWNEGLAKKTWVFLPHSLQTPILPISTSQVPRITGLSHHIQLNLWAFELVSGLSWINQRICPTFTIHLVHLQWPHLFTPVKCKTVQSYKVKFKFWKEVKGEAQSEPISSPNSTVFIIDSQNMRNTTFLYTRWNQ
jgi:hypothetical protein